MMVGLQRQLSSGNVMGLVSVVPRWAGRASLLLIPVQRFSHTSTLVCLQSWRHACLWQTLDFWGTQWAPLLYFLFAKFCCIPVNPLCTWALQRCHAALMAGPSGRQEALLQVMQSSWWPMVPVDILSYVQACFACTWAKKQMQRLQGLSQPLSTPEQPWPVISMDFNLV